MPRYYFDTFDGSSSSTDNDGVDCSTRKEIQDAAVDALPDMAREILPDGPNRIFRVDVRGAGDRVLFRASLELKSEWLGGDSLE